MGINSTIAVNLIYAKFLAQKREHAIKCSRPVVFEVAGMFEVHDCPGGFIHTGVTIVSEDASLQARPLNSYNKFALLVLHSDFIREMILNYRYEELYFTVKADGTTHISYKERENVVEAKPGI